MEALSSSTPNFLQIFEDLLICPVSFQALTKAVTLYPCVHRVNKAVAKKLSNCPLCRQDIETVYTDAPLRNLARLFACSGTSWMVKPRGKDWNIIEKSSTLAEQFNHLYSCWLDMSIHKTSVHSSSLIGSALDAIYAFAKQHPEFASQTPYANPELVQMFQDLEDQYRKFYTMRPWSREVQACINASTLMLEQFLEKHPAYCLKAKFSDPYRRFENEETENLFLQLFESYNADRRLYYDELINRGIVDKGIYKTSFEKLDDFASQHWHDHDFDERRLPY